MEIQLFFKKNFIGKANGAPPLVAVLVGSIPTPEFFRNLKNFEGGYSKD